MTPVPREILSAVARVTGIPVRVIVGNTRDSAVAHARTLFVCACRQYTAMSYPQIARAMRCRNHTTAVVAHRRADRITADQWEAVLTRLRLPYRPLRLCGDEPPRQKRAVAPQKRAKAAAQPLPTPEEIEAAKREILTRDLRFCDRYRPDRDIADRIKTELRHGAEHDGIPARTE